MQYIYKASTCSCSTCPTINLAVKDFYKPLQKAFDKAVRYIHQEKGFDSTLLQHGEVKPLLNELNRVFTDAYQTGIADNVLPETLVNKLQNDVFLFSACKTYAQLKEVSTLLLDENKQIRSFSSFQQEAQKINQQHNEQYLQAEYQFATGSSLMAAKWHDFEKDGDQYNLQYRTAGDNRVRDEHSKLHNITLPVTDSFWDSYFPPNGWRCRCTVVQVSKDKYAVSDSKTAHEAADKATTQLDKDGNNALAIFRFNPGKQQVIFPPKHPYYRSKNEIQKVLK